MILKRFFFLLSFVMTSLLFSQEQYPKLSAIVTDSAGIFTPPELADLKKKLANFETETTNQLVVLTIESLGFETIEGYANGTFNTSGLGQKGKDNGILILFAAQDREVRIEVGYGLEPYITDAIASRIIRNSMIPNFKEGLYYEGLDLGTDRIITLLKNPEALAEFENEIAKDERSNKIMVTIFLVLFFSIFIGVGGFQFYRSYVSLIEVFRGVLIGKLGLFPALFMMFGAGISALFGLVFIVVPLFIGASIYLGELENVWTQNFMEQPKLLLWLVLPFLGIALFIAFIKVKFFGKSGFKLSWIANDSTYYRKTFSSSGTHSFGSSSSGGSSSSFSGGGGSSGGGGASGSW